jgi:glutamate racemase
VKFPGVFSWICIFIKMNKAIGIFDSGIGGLTVVKELTKRLPGEDIVYFGDTARVPYGTKSPQTVIKFTIENILFLLKHNVKLIILACNTSSSLALASMRKYFKVPMIGVIRPGAKEAVYASLNKRIGVIGTRATIESGAYEKEIKALDSSIRVFSQACPLFVPLVEEGWASSIPAEEIAHRYLKPIKDAGVDTLILGCTHYPLLKPLIREVMGKTVRLIDSASQIAREVEEILKDEGIKNSRRKGSAKHTFYVSDDPSSFAKLGKKFLGRELRQVRRKPDV